MATDRYLTVSALTRYIKRKLEMDKHLKEIWLKAEISNFNHHSRGHMYFTLKDDRSRIQAVMFSGNNRTIKFKPENGMNVLVKGEVSIYEPQGQYQLYVQTMEPDGIGALYLAFEQLKEKLHREGLFDPLQKKAIPSYPSHIGVVTSPTGAAIQDILTTIKRRYPLVKVSIFPVLVQGEKAASSVVAAIEKANQLNLFDVLIVGRGGGSIEELWCFNEEAVARAIAKSKIPIISAVGHETDYTISDFVADVRAATPTGAAELAVPSQTELINRVNTLTRSLHMVVKGTVLEQTRRLSQVNKSYAFRYPEQLLRQKEQDLDKSVEKLGRIMTYFLNQKKEGLRQIRIRFGQQHPQRQIDQAKQHLQLLYQRNDRAMRKEWIDKQTSFNQVLDKLTLLNPLETMKRGYAIATEKNGQIIKSTKQTQPGDLIMVRLQDGTLDCQVWGIEEGEEI
ncbi:exodeoxyribonuclease VII large subunit [Aquibacillus sp. 3ASR75-11]|uniref:Exodeoxyribonuclease 7 large subunit n=1 Tax=Terrihalobacillus insolitus TaxID=2950438 RepID=A0A9X3WTA8_9BACI|nr:exodeoxyribonuclease VII large subunit [Terrihalobacillus insolitus]MDC3414435.1 exodeoxyribonuclease VII large subunit [Terrihalobacillus insolitus]MDC3425315.1 exodeoxyribonuclease VII large subunit [Terrihalobacillus insolitus]